VDLWRRPTGRTSGFSRRARALRARRKPRRATNRHRGCEIANPEQSTALARSLAARGKPGFYSGKPLHWHSMRVHSNLEFRRGFRVCTRKRRGTGEGLWVSGARLSRNDGAGKDRPLVGDRPKKRGFAWHLGHTPRLHGYPAPASVWPARCRWANRPAPPSRRRFGRAACI